MCAIKSTMTIKFVIDCVVAVTTIHTAHQLFGENYAKPIGSCPLLNHLSISVDSAITRASQIESLHLNVDLYSIQHSSKYVKSIARKKNLNHIGIARKKRKRGRFLTKQNTDGRWKRGSA